MRRWTVLLMLASGLAACHDSPRSNPLDPELTPAVELAAAANDTAGTVALSWAPYSGTAAFREYLVLRNVSHSTVVETLYVALSPDSIRFVDWNRQPDTTHEYRVAVVNQAGLEIESAVCVVSGYTVAGVQLLAAAADPLAGSIELVWQGFSGPAFTEYQVVRRQVGTDREEVLGTRLAVTDTAWTDSTALAEVDYVYQVITLAAGRRLGSVPLEARLHLPAVTILRADIASSTASATLTWSGYRGLRFTGYRLERRTAGLAWQEVFVSQAIADTSFVDGGLWGNTEYAYRVVVTTARDEEVTSAETTGAFHRLVDTQPITPVSGVLLNSRLYGQAGERLLGVTVGLEGVLALLSHLPEPAHGVMNPAGRPPWLDGQIDTPVGAAGCVTADGRTRIAVSDGQVLALTACDGQGKPLHAERELLANALAGPIGTEQATVLGEVEIAAERAAVVLDSVAVTAAGTPVRMEGFAAAEAVAARWTTDRTIEQLAKSMGWYRHWPAGVLSLLHSSLSDVGPVEPEPSFIRCADPTWRDPALRAKIDFDVIAAGQQRLRLSVGGDTYSRYTLLLDWKDHKATLVHSFVPPAGSSSPASLDVHAQA